MSDDQRNLLVDVKSCIGCLACSNVCPANLIELDDCSGKRTIRFPRICEEDCALCMEACPEKAITFVIKRAAPGEGFLTASFDLISCERCRAPFITEPILRKLEMGIPVQLQKDAVGSSWLLLCPACRQSVEGERTVKGLRRHAV